MTPPVIALADASFGYDGRPVVTRADLAIGAGERVALLGANGSGKSTLVRGLLGLNEHLGGDVRLFGEPLARFHRRHLIGYVPQRHTLSSSVAATVTEIVTVGRLPHLGLRPRPSTADRRIVAESIELVGLASQSHDEVAHLSGGQQRRVLIARALAGSPEVLVLDEPTAGVDVGAQASLARVLSRLADAGSTLLVVTHEIGPLTDLLERVVTMSAGQIVGDVSIADHQGANDQGGHHRSRPGRRPGEPPVTSRGPLDA